MSLIELDSVEVYYGDLKALDGISCTLEGGAIGLLGPNGAGKSTLLKTLLGYNRATKGTVTLLGLPMPKNALAVRSQLGYMPEREVVSPKISAVVFLTYCGRLFGMSRVDAMERTHEVLNYVGLGESRYRKMETYSTGMLQRVKLAQALLHDPQLLLLDEPTNGLDPDGRIEMLNLIAEVADRKHITVLLSSHLLPDVQHVCERVIMINQGKIVQQGTISELTAPLAHQYEVRVRDNKTLFIQKLNEEDITYRDLHNGNLLISGLNNGEARKLFALAEVANTHIRHFQPARGSLSDVFLHALGKEPNETCRTNKV